MNVGKEDEGHLFLDLGSPKPLPTRTRGRNKRGGSQGREGGGRIARGRREKRKEGEGNSKDRNVRGGLHACSLKGKRGGGRREVRRYLSPSAWRGGGEHTGRGGGGGCCRWYRIP